MMMMMKMLMMVVMIIIIIITMWHRERCYASSIIFNHQALNVFYLVFHVRLYNTFSGLFERAMVDIGRNCLPHLKW